LVRVRRDPKSGALAPATTYYFRLNAQNSFGTTNGSILNFKTSGPPLTVSVPVVTTQVAGAVATTTATLRGTVNPVGAQTTYYYRMVAQNAGGIVRGAALSFKTK